MHWCCHIQDVAGALYRNQTENVVGVTTRQTVSKLQFVNHGSGLQSVDEWLTEEMRYCLSPRLQQWVDGSRCRWKTALGLARCHWKCPVADGRAFCRCHTPLSQCLTTATCTNKYDTFTCITIYSGRCCRCIRWRHISMLNRVNSMLLRDRKILLVFTINQMTECKSFWEAHSVVKQQNTYMLSYYVAKSQLL